MKACLVSSVLFSIVMAHTTTAVGQGVYVTPGDQGPVFSDKPQRGAKEVTLPPLTIVAPPKKTKASKEAKSAAPEASAPAPDSPKPDAAVVAYRLLRCAWPSIRHCNWGRGTPLSSASMADPSGSGTRLPSS